MMDFLTDIQTLDTHNKGTQVFGLRGEGNTSFETVRYSRSFSHIQTFIQTAAVFCLDTYAIGLQTCSFLQREAIPQVSGPQ